MTEVEPQLTREELAAFLADPACADRPARRIPGTRRLRPVERALAEFAEEQSRLAATVHQRPIRFELLGCDSMPVGDFAAALADADRAFTLRIDGVRDVGAIVMGRTLLFGWLTMAFGSPANLSVPVPRRAYTRIELRVLRRLVGELVEQMNRSLAVMLPARCDVGEVLEPERLPERVSPRLLTAAFDVEGLGEPGRLRIGFPQSWIQDDEQTTPVRSEARVDVGRLMEMPLEVRAEVGHAELPLRRLTALKPGDVIPIEGFAGGRILVRIADAPRFKAVRGSAGAQAAIRIVSE
jgi:flagellar motor switch protein FliM